ncbi:MAG TPA: glycosyltransferase family 9 protein [Planctomycetota bacterium]|nr:glycosyltransferase family 9 protein [Planctomycetota bacterium]
MRDPQRILLVRLSHLGDVVHALPLFHALRSRFPAARIAWVTQPEYAELVAPLPGLERVLVFGRREGARAWLRLRDDIQAFDPDLAVDAQGNFKSALAVLSAGSARRVGLHRCDWREPLGALALSETAPPAPGGAPHAVDRMLALARHLTGAGDEPRCDPALSDAERAHGREVLERLLPARRAGAERAVLVQLAAAGDVRSWPAEHFERLLRALDAAGRPALAISGPAEEALGRELEASLGAGSGRIAHWVGQRGLRELAALFQAAGERGALLVACDSGPMHLAAACGLRVLALSGPQDHGRTGPWPPAAPMHAHAANGHPHRVLRADPGPACAPCFARRCSHERGPVCMRDITAARAAEAALELTSA